VKSAVRHRSAFGLRLDEDMQSGRTLLALRSPGILNS
jgi:hypothetical protein